MLRMNTIIAKMRFRRKCDFAACDYCENAKTPIRCFAFAIVFANLRCENGL